MHGLGGFYFLAIFVNEITSPTFRRPESQFQSKEKARNVVSCSDRNRPMISAKNVTVILMWREKRPKGHTHTEMAFLGKENSKCIFGHQ